jgi:hypothetical protein
VRTPEKLREVAIQLHTLKVAEGLEVISVKMTHHWRDAQDEPQKAPCTIALQGEKLTIIMTVDRSNVTVYEGPINWLYGVTRYDEVE